ncbi:hypothetical protein [Phaffia rhodozyma]|uniref:Uncharacterized protein n=1 Tax=Phaffia rhodozyma TaxID=264483 RepID=A0A0F7SZ74_PHARH|nr:hypothetical protein [Phaffia rhodozyma]
MAQFLQTPPRQPPKRSQPRHKVVFDLHLQHAALYQLPSTGQNENPPELGNPLLWQGSQSRGSLKFRLRLRSPPSICLLLDDARHEMVIPLDGVTSLRLLSPAEVLTDREASSVEETPAEIEKRLSLGGLILEMGIIPGCRKEFRLRQPNRYVQLGKSSNIVDPNRPEVEGDFTRGAAGLTNLVRMTIHSTVTRELTTAMTALVIRALRVKDSQPMEILDLGSSAISSTNSRVRSDFSTQDCISDSRAELDKTPSAVLVYTKEGESLRAYTMKGESTNEPLPIVPTISSSSFEQRPPQSMLGSILASFLGKQDDSNQHIVLRRSSDPVGIIGDARPKLGPVSREPTKPVVLRNRSASVDLTSELPVLEDIFSNSSFEYNLRYNPDSHGPRPCPPLQLGLGFVYRNANTQLPPPTLSSSASTASSLTDSDHGELDGFTQSKFDSVQPRGLPIYSVRPVSTKSHAKNFDFHSVQAVQRDLFLAQQYPLPLPPYPKNGINQPNVVEFLTAVQTALPRPAPDQYVQERTVMPPTSLSHISAHKQASGW